MVITILIKVTCSCTGGMDLHGINPGNDIIGESLYDRCGSSISLSSSGEIVAIVLDIMMEVALTQDTYEFINGMTPHGTNLETTLMERLKMISQEFQYL